ncbi:MAG: hypothetical protein ABIB12_01125 [Patescibacteria group bacterium]
MGGALAYMLLALGLGLIGRQFLSSCLQARRGGKPCQIGLLLALAFIIPAVQAGIAGLGLFFPELARFTLLLSYTLFAAGAAAALYLTFYVLPLRLPYWAGIGSVAVFGSIAGATLFLQETNYLLYGGAFLLSALGILPLAFTFHLFASLSRDAEVKQKSFGLLLLAVGWLTAEFAALVLVPIAGFPVQLGYLALGFLGASCIGSVLLPATQAALRGARFRSSLPSPQIMEFLAAI